LGGRYQEERGVEYTVLLVCCRVWGDCCVVVMVAVVVVVVVVCCGSFCFVRELCAYMAGVGG
jgi:hypothetical protein